MREFILTHTGEIAALGTAVCFTLNAISFESAGKKVGSLSVSYIRLFIAFILLSISAYITRGLIMPADATTSAWFWLLISGLFGFVLGDLFLFEAFVEIGSRISLLIMSASPPITALAGFLFMREKLSIFALIGMTLNMLGISLVILSRGADEKKVEFNRPVKGIIFACLGALGQAAGLIFSKIGMGSYNPLAATQIRIIAAVIGYTIIITWRNRWQEIKDSFKNKKALMQIAAGSVTGPYIGVVLSLVALQHTAAGIVSSITSISPIIIIPASIVIFKEKILPKEILGAFISIAGVMLLFL
jgi:drug/metabolite transporter (DMT)-like permease